MIFVSKAAQIYLGNGGIYAASALGGLTSVDAIIISLTQLVTLKFSSNIISIAVIIIIISNSAVKSGIAFIWGSRELGIRVIKGLGSVSFIAAVYLIIELLF